MNYPPSPNEPPSSMDAGAPPPVSGPGRWVTVQFAGVKPTVTYTLLVITVIVFLLQLASELLMGGEDLPVTIGVKANQAILQGQLWRLITPVFLHGSLLHIAFNMYALYSIGPQLERHYGHWRYLALYLLAGFAGNVASFMFSASDSLGASTAIFGLIGAYGVFLYANRRIFGETARRALINVITIAVINLVLGLSPGIDNWGHVGGLVSGTLFAWFAGPLLQVRETYPVFSLVDTREPGEVLRAGFSVALLFTVLASIVFYLRLQ